MYALERPEMYALCLHKSNEKKKTTLTAYFRRPFLNKNIERHTAHTIVLWPNPIQWQIGHTYDLIIIIRQSTHSLTIIRREMGKLNTHSPIYCIKNNCEKWLNLRHTLDRMYLTSDKCTIIDRNIVKQHQMLILSARVPYDKLLTAVLWSLNVDF